MTLSSTHCEVLCLFFFFFNDTATTEIYTLSLHDALPISVGPYTLLRVDRGRLEPGLPGQFFMLEAPGRLLPRPMSLCLAGESELAFLIDPIGPGTRALCSLEPGDRLAILGPLGNGFRLDVERPLLVRGGIGIAPLPYLSERLDKPPAVLGGPTSRHAGAAQVVPDPG